MTPTPGIRSTLRVAGRTVGIVLLGAFVVLGLAVNAGSALLASPAPVGRVPPPDLAGGPYAATGTHDVGLRHVDAAAAAVPFTVWYPAEGPDDDPAPDGPTVTYSYGLRVADADTALALATYPGRATPGAEPDRRDGPYPLVVLSPGFAITVGSYAWLAEHLASYGFVVAAPRHDESLDPRLLWRATVDRPRDVTDLIADLALRTRPGGDLAGLVDLDSIAVAGHSYGGYTALAAAGAHLDTAALHDACAGAGHGGPLTFQCDALLPHLDDIADHAGLDGTPDGPWPSWPAHDVDAVIALAGDAAMFGPDGLAAVTAPVLAIGGSADTDSPYEWGTAAAYAHTSGTRKIEIKLLGADHFVFAGRCDSPRAVVRLTGTGFCADPAGDRQRAHDVVAHHATAFLLDELNGDAAAAATLDPGTSRRTVEYRTSSN